MLFAAGNDSMALLRAGRLPVVGLSVLAGLAVFLWSRARFGPLAAKFSALFPLPAMVLAPLAAGDLRPSWTRLRPWLVVLPVYPLLFTLAGGLALVALRLGGAGTAALAITAGAQAGTTLLAHPDHLSYFNPAAGGTRAGPQWLDDSNVDWGEGLYRLPGWLRERGIQKVRLLYFGTGVPAAYGVATEPLLPSDWRVEPRPGAYVISAHWLVHGLYLARTEGAKSDWLHRYEPDDVLGGSLYLYVFPEPVANEVTGAGGGSRGR